MSVNPEEPLPPEQEALVGQFVQQLNAESGEVIALVNTPVGLIRITDEDNAKIRQAAVEETIRLIKLDPPKPTPLVGKIIQNVAGASLAAAILAGAAYVVHLAVRAIVGG